MVNIVFNKCNDVAFESRFSEDQFEDTGDTVKMKEDLYLFINESMLAIKKYEIKDCDFAVISYDSFSHGSKAYYCMNMESEQLIFDKADTRK